MSVFDRAKKLAADGLGTAKEKIDQRRLSQKTQEAKDAVMDLTDPLLDKGAKKVQEAKDAMKDLTDPLLETAAAKKAQEAKDAMMDLTNPIFETAQEGLESAKQKLAEKGAMKACKAKAAMIDLSAPIRTTILMSLREVLKDKLTSDRDMWLSVKKWLRSVVDDLWYDVTFEVEASVDEVKHGILGHNLDVEGLAMVGNAPVRFSPGWVRAKMLYHFLPYDKSIFGQMKDAFWWVLLVFSLVPTYGVRVAFFTVIFVMIICKRPFDEFQLVKFILNFKGTQFISSGIMGAFVGATRYFLCVQPGGIHTCDVDGPQIDPASGCADILGSCILVWLAFLVLPFSERTGGLRPSILSEDEDDEEAQTTTKDDGCCPQRDPERGGRLRALLRWDLKCFIASCIFLLILLMRDCCLGPEARPVSANAFLKVAESWRLREALYWTKVLYALLSIPFFIFWLPVFQTILTHTIPTGFNANGACVSIALYEEE